jgi:hypothetical protein
MIERADTDGDGVISEEEFYNIITKKSHWGIHLFYLIISNKISLFQMHHCYLDALTYITLNNIYMHFSLLYYLSIADDSEPR